MKLYSIIFSMIFFLTHSSLEAANEGIQLSEFSCDAAVEKGNSIVLVSKTPVYNVSFDYSYTSRADPKIASAFYLMLENSAGTKESVVFWSSPISLPNAAPDSLAMQSHTPQIGSGDFMEVAELPRKEHYWFSANGKVDVKISQGKFTVEYDDILSGLNKKRATLSEFSSIIKPVKVTLGCFYGEYEFSNISVDE